MARAPKPAKIEPVVTSKCTSGRPLLIDSAPQTEFSVTHSKQTTEKFLTGARTHISIFNFSPFTTQNPTQLIQLLHARPARKAASPATLLPGSAQNIENDVTSTKQTTEDFLPGAPTTPSLSPENASFTIKISVEPRGGPHDSNPRKEGTMRRAELSLRASGVAAVICMTLAASQVPARAQRREQPMEHRGEHSREPSTAYRTIQVDGLNIFYREAGPKDAPTLLLLHGLPSSSRMFDPLFVRLADRYPLVAPNCPGFGHSDWPEPKRFAYTFDHIAEIMNHFTEALGLTRYTLYMQDYGGPVGFRMILAHPERAEALIVQDAVAHNEGLGANWKTRRAFWADRAAYESALRTNLLSMPTTRARHVGD